MSAEESDHTFVDDYVMCVVFDDYAMNKNYEGEYTLFKVKKIFALLYDCPNRQGFHLELLKNLKFMYQKELKNRLKVSTFSSDEQEFEFWRNHNSSLHISSEMVKMLYEYKGMMKTSAVYKDHIFNDAKLI